MSEVSKLINLLIEFGEKLEGHLNKKYRPVIKSMLSLSELSKSIKPDSVFLGQEMIAFKLGIESKSTKCIEMTLNFLLKLFSNGFVNIHAPNYCEDFVITESNIEKKPKEKHDREMRHEMVKWLEPLIHFKDKEINNLLLSNYEYLIGQPILGALLELSEQVWSEKCYLTICSYFTYRFYVYEEIYYYTKSEISQFKYLPINQKLQSEIEAAYERESQLTSLMNRYVGEIASRASGQGGKFGICVMCDNPAEHFCKFTKASLCSIDCKKKHLELADKEFQNHNQALMIEQHILEGFEILADYLIQKESPFVFAVLANLLEKPSLFQIVKRNMKEIIKNFIPQILYKGYESKNDKIIQTMYFLIPSLLKWWPAETLPEIEFFIKEYILKIFADKKPDFKSLLLVFKSLDKMFESGRSIVELYVNLDCEVNKTNVIGTILFELSKIAQDKFTHSNHYNKQEKITLKNSCMTLYLNFCHALNEFRKSYPSTVNVKKIQEQKMKKPDLEKFVEKFNEHWREGLKTLFNLNLVGLESNQEIVNIIMSLAGLNKKMIDSMMFEENCSHYLEIFMSRLMEEPEHIVLKLLSLYKFIPMTNNDSVGLLQFVNACQKIDNDPNLLQKAKKITNIFLTVQTFEEFKSKISEFFEEEQPNYDYLYLRMVTVRKPETIGKKKQSYTLTLSQSFLTLLSQELALLQIPLEHLLGSGYDIERILTLVKELVPICFHSNWLSLLAKHSGVNVHGEKHEKNFTLFNVKIIKGVLEIIMMEADYVVEWDNVFRFVCNLHYILTCNSNRKVNIDNRALLSQEMTAQIVENCLVSASMKCSEHFNKFVIALLNIAKEQLLNENIMMLQKFFHVLDANVDKYVANFDQIFDELNHFISELKENTPIDTYIYICDMFKQLLLKILRNPEISDEIIVRHFQILKIILEKTKNFREVGDFVMNSLSTIILYNYNLKPMSWKQALEIVDEQTLKFPEQTGIIVRKILNEHMKGIENESENLLKICIKLINPSDSKSSIEAIHDVKMIIDLHNKLLSDEYSEEKEKDEEKEQSEEKQEEKKEEKQEEKETNENISKKELVHPEQSKDVKHLKSLLIFSISELIKLLTENFNEVVAETLFSLFSVKIQYKKEDFRILSEKEINQFIETMFQVLETMTGNKREEAERILNETLFWSVKNKNKGIIDNLEKIILNKYTTLSLAALKCLKTYIQMSNLREEKDWESIEFTLFKIINSTNVERFFEIHEPEQIEESIKKMKENLLDKEIPNNLEVDLETFIHECRIQIMAVELLPNHKKCLDTLEKTYKLKIKFNDDIILRLGIWKKGLGNEFPPDLLLLEETISNRIMAIHIWEDDSEKILELCESMLKRYIDASNIMEILEQAHTEMVANANAENYKLYKVTYDYWKKRRQPLIKPIGYIMPKLTKYCKKKSDRKKIILYLLKIMPIVDNKEAVIKTISELKNKEIVS